MLKINLRDTPAEERWILHGRLTAPWVRELRERTTEPSRCDHVSSTSMKLRLSTKAGSGFYVFWLAKERMSRERRLHQART